MSDTTQSEIVTMANAFREVAETMKSVHRVFIRLAIWIPVIMVAFMMLLSVIIVQMGWNTEKRMTERLDALPERVTRALSVNQTQNVNIEPDRNELGRLTREVLINDRNAKTRRTQ